jgi:hypothetical protein
MSTSSAGVSSSLTGIPTSVVSIASPSPTAGSRRFRESGEFSMADDAGW